MLRPARALAAFSLLIARTLMHHVGAIVDAGDIRALATEATKLVLLGISVAWLAFVVGMAWRAFRFGAGLD